MSKMMYALLGTGALAVTFFGGALVGQAGANETPAAVSSPAGLAASAAPTIAVKGAAPVATTPAKPAAPAAPTIGGDDLVHVGQDVPAGTYRAAEKLDGEGCYWKKSRDAEGSDIIDNGLPSGGRPQVTLKKGQWFTSEDCPIWVKAS